jgi:protein TonB
VKRIPDFNDIVFENRNKKYGAYLLRRKYARNVNISLFAGILFVSVVLIIPYLNARALGSGQMRSERQVEIKMENLDQPNETVVIPPPPPDPPQEVVAQVKYIPPEIVDSVKPEDNTQLMTADQAQILVLDKEAVEEVELVTEEIQEKDNENEPFMAVEEMPEPSGGWPDLYKHIAQNTIYPKRAQENNIQGKVFVRFCVTSKGNIDKISIYRGIDPDLDAEAIRVVKTFPEFKPGKQSGRPVPVWLIVNINFQLI